MQQKKKQLGSGLRFTSKLWEVIWGHEQFRYSLRKCPQVNLFLLKMRFWALYFSSHKFRGRCYKQLDLLERGRFEKVVYQDIWVREEGGGGAWFRFRWRRLLPLYLDCVVRLSLAIAGKTKIPFTQYFRTDGVGINWRGIIKLSGWIPIIRHNNE